MFFPVNQSAADSLPLSGETVLLSENGKEFTTVAIPLCYNAALGYFLVADPVGEVFAVKRKSQLSEKVWQAIAMEQFSGSSMLVEEREEEDERLHQRPER